MKKILISMFLLFVSNAAFSAAPTCYSAGYCDYTGKVAGVYVNADGQILIYFDTNVTVEVASTAGFSIANTNAAVFNVAENADVAKMFYSTALAAQATGRDINIQMVGVSAGYLKFDRVYLASQ